MNGELESKIELEYEKINQLNQIQDELNTMNKSLNNCVDIAYSSALNKKNANRYAEIKEKIEDGYKLANENLDSSIVSAQESIHKLEEEKAKREEETEEKKED